MGSLHIGIGRAGKMRTNIEIDDRLMREAMRSSGKRTKRAAVEAGLRLLVQTQAQAKIRRVGGEGPREGEHPASRGGGRAQWGGGGGGVERRGGVSTPGGGEKAGASG